jgi:hypothetical protein
MQMHSGETDQTHQIKLPSAIERVQWADLRAAPGGTVGLEVSTRYVGNGSTLQIKLTDHQGTTHGTFKNQIHNNHLSAEVQVPPKAKDALYAEVKLPKHGLMQKSPALLLTGPVNITNAEWSKDEARRGDVLTLSADVKGVPDGTEARVQIFEHDEESAHDPVTELSALVEKKKVEVEWEYEYHEDTDRIPTEEEAAKGYRPPEYFFRVEVEGVEAKSGLLTFKDQLSLQLIDAVEQVAYALQDYLINLPDGTEETGTLDEKGRLQMDKALPGSYEVIFPEIYDKEPQGQQVEESSGEDDVIDLDEAPGGEGKTRVKSGDQHRVEHRRGSFKEEFKIMVATIYGEAANSSEIAWKAIAHVIMNRVGYREWKEHKTPKEVIKNTGFDAYTYKNEPYKKAYKYMSNTSRKNNENIERMIEAVRPIYIGKEKDITDGAVLYYSPEAQKDLHKEKPSKYKERPSWNFDIIKEANIDGLRDTDDFKFYKYK